MTPITYHAFDRQLNNIEETDNAHSLGPDNVYRDETLGGLRHELERRRADKFVC